MDKDILYIAEEKLRRLPCQPDFKLVLMHNNEETISIRNGQTDQMLHSTARSLAMNLFIDGRDGFFYTSNLDARELDEFLRKAVDTTLMLEPDADRTLPDPSRYYHGGGPELLNFDSSLSTMDPVLKMQLACSNNDECRQSDHRIISLQSRYADRQHQAHYLTSNGFQGYDESSRCSLTTIVTVDGKDGQHPMDGWGETRIFFRDMPSEGIAREGLRRALRKIGQRPTKSGRYDMILESPVAGTFLQPLLSSMNGQALQQKMSFLQGKLGERVLSPLVSIVDDPLIPGTRGACHFDFDGVATRRRTLFQEGVLQMYFIDTVFAHKLHMEPTTQSIHHLIVTPGQETLEQIISRTQRAILVTDFNGGNCDPNTGNFSYGIEGFLIEGGIITQPLSGMNVTGNMLDVWQRVSALANDFDPWETELIPSILFEDVAFGGSSF